LYNPLEASGFDSKISLQLLNYTLVSMIALLQAAATPFKLACLNIIESAKKVAIFIFWLILVFLKRGKHIL
jgi:hypothetical protein